MKRFYKFLMPLVAIVAMAMPARVAAQATCDNGTITVSNADTSTTTTSYFPAYAYYNYSVSEQIVPADALEGLGEIHSMQFKPSTTTAGTYYNNCEVYLSNTTAENLAAGWITTDLHLVFTGSLNYTTTDWQTITFDSAFNYTGGNLLVLVRRGHGDYVSGCGFQAYNAGPSMGRYAYRDGSAIPIVGIPDGASSGSTSTVGWYKFTGCYSPVTCARIASVSVSDIIPDGATISWVDTLNSGASYTIANMANDSIIASGVTDTFYVITGLDSYTNYNIGVYAECGSDLSGVRGVSFTTLRSCPAPTELAIDSVSTDEITISWTPGYQESSWLLSINDSVIEVYGSPYTISDLTPNTVYTLRLRALCTDDTSLYSQIATRTLPGEPVNVFPYTCDFEDTVENAGWVLENGSQPNAWYIGTAVNNGGTNALYVSNNNGTSNAYNNGTSSHVYAYRYINFSDTGSYAFSFDWRCEGESHYYDYLRAWIAPASVNHEAGDGTTYNYSTLAVPGCIDLVGANSDGQYTLAQTSNFTTHAGEFRITTPGTYKLVFLWSNDGSGGSNPPAAVDNVFINTNSCPAPYNLTATYVGTDTIELSWTAGGSETSWLVTVNGGTPESVSSNTLTLDGLNANTVYNINVQAECGGDDVSIPATISVRTACGTINLPFSEDFTGMASSSYPDCWTRVMSGSFPYITTSYGNSIQFAGTAAVIAPHIDASLNQMIVSFDLRKEGSSSGSMTFGYTSDPVAASDMVVLQTIDPATTATYYHYEYDLSLDTSLATLDPDSVYYLVWRQSSTATNWYYWLDNVSIEQYNPCSKPQNFTCTSTQPDSVVVMWDAGEATSWELYVGPAGVPVNEDSAFAVTDSVYVFTNLQGGVAYNFYVRTNCSGDYSNWAGPLAVTPGQYIIGTSGSASITMCGGVIYDDGGATGQYSNSADFVLTVHPSHPDSMLTFQGTAYTESSVDYLRIYEGTSPSGTPLWETSTSSQLDNIPYTIVTSGPITLKWHTDGSVVYDGFELQIGCMAAPDCSPVDNLTVHPTPTAALVTWQPGYYGNYTGADIEYKADTSETWISLPSVTGTYTVITGLDPVTDYNVRVTTDCDGFPGGVATADFTTANYGCLVADSTGSRTVTVGTGSSTTSYFPTYSCYNYALSEQVFTPTELGGGGNLVSMTMTPTSVVSANRSVEIYLGHVSSNTLSNFVYPTDLTLVYTGTTNFVANQPYTFTLDNAFMYNGSDNLLVLFRDMTGSYSCSNNFAATSSTSGVSRYVYQDSGPYSLGFTGGYSSSDRANTTFGFLSCSQYASCAAPAAAAIDVTTTTVTLAWAPGSSETSWNVYYRLAGSSNWSAPTAVTVNSHTFTGLLSGRRYEFMVENTCSEGDFATTTNATTLCAQISSLPFTENFNDWGTGVTPNCWSNQAGYSPTSYGIISSSYNCSGSTGGSIYMYSSSGTYVTYLALPELDTTVYQPNQLQLVFNLFYNSTSYSAPQVEVGVMTSQENSASFVPVDTVTHSGALATWEVFEVPLANYTGNGTYVAIRTNYPGTYSYFYLDDLTLEVIPTCPRPDSLAASNATTNSIDLAWHERGGATSWIIEYGPRGFELGTGTTVVASSNPFTLTGLPSSYQGEYYVKSICGAGDTGEYSRTGCAFGTTQIPATLPYNYDFENPAEWANWQTSTNHETNNWYRGTSVADSGSYSMYVATGDTASYYGYSFNSVVNAAAYRDIDFGPIDSSYTITFRARAGGTTDARYDAMMVFLVDPSLPTIASTSNITSPWGNVNDLYRIATIYLDTTWQTYEASFDTISGIHRVAFFWFNQNTGASYTNIPQPGAVDNIHIAYSSCPRPVSLEAVPSTTSALLTWQGASNATYEITYRVVGGTNQTAIANTNSFNLTGLTSPAEYLAWVRKICGVGDSSLHSDGVRFTTLCSPINLPYTEDFNSVTATTYSTAGSLPLCWEGYSNGTDAAYDPHVVGSGSYWYSNDNTNALTMTSGSSTYGDTKIVALPVLNANLSTCVMSFYYRMESTSYGDLEVGYFTGYDLENDFVPVDTMTRTSTITLDSVSFAGIPSTAVRLGFRWTHNDSYYSVGIDNITVVGQGGCSSPVVNVTNITYQSATVTAIGNNIGYELTYGTDPSNLGNAMTSTDGNFTITGLTPATQYFIAVTQLCDSGVVSSPALGSFTTDSLPCFEPTGLAVVNTTFNSAELSWTSTGNATSWVVSIVGAGATRYDTVSTNPYTVTGLYADQTYTVMVMALCGGGAVQSGWSEPISFTTDICTPVSNVTVSDITATSAKVNWNGVNGSMGYKLYYGAPGFYEEEAATAEAAATATSYTITGLNPETEYEVYVRNRCTETLYSNVTANDRVPFTTLSSSEGIYDVESGTLTLYPNPASEKVTVTVSGFEGEVEVEIVDMNGRRVAGYTTMDSELTINVSDLAQGAYFVRVTGDTHTAVRKLIVK